jgi:hypothetical protein
MAPRTCAFYLGVLFVLPNAIILYFPFSWITKAWPVFVMAFVLFPDPSNQCTRSMLMAVINSVFSLLSNYVINSQSAFCSLLRSTLKLSGGSSKLRNCVFLLYRHYFKAVARKTLKVDLLEVNEFWVNSDFGHFCSSFRNWIAKISVAMDVSLRNDAALSLTFHLIVCQLSVAVWVMSSVKEYPDSIGR